MNTNDEFDTEHSDAETTATDAGVSSKGRVVLLDDTEVDPEVAAQAAAAVKRRASKWIRRHDVDYENGRT